MRLSACEPICGGDRDMEAATHRGVYRVKLTHLDRGGRLPIVTRLLDGMVKLVTRSNLDAL
jgi:hypothetical protein